MSEIIPAAFWQGIEEFNQHEFYACHDTLEALWMESMEPEKRFYQGVLQIAVGLYHLSNQNRRGAMMLMGEGIRRLDYYQPDYSGINVEKLVIQTSVLLKQLQQAEVEKIDNLSQLEIPKIDKL
ncbi:MAG: DUF309 domain-containing protein [Microcoleaceae cyanobacterium]